MNLSVIRINEINRRAELDRFIHNRKTDKVWVPGNEIMAALMKINQAAVNWNVVIPPDFVDKIDMIVLDAIGCGIRTVCFPYQDGVYITLKRRVEVAPIQEKSSQVPGVFFFFICDPSVPIPEDWPGGLTLTSWVGRTPIFYASVLVGHSVLVLYALLSTQIY